MPDKTEKTSSKVHEFSIGNLQIKQGANYTKEEFFKKFKGYLKVDIEKAWKEYMKFKKKHK